MNAPHQPGEIVADRYRIVETLGEGGNGITYKAELLQESHLEEGQPENHRYVALKALSLRHMEDWKPLELFEREARILQHLNHHRIPRYLDYFHVDTPDNRAFYIVQELVEGQSLAAMVEKGWRTNEAGVRRIVIQVLEILLYLQDLKPLVIHRDIKPQNLIWGKDGQIFLVDFGAVRDTYKSTLARGSTVVGTFGYMAPEQFQGHAVPATDLYGLGATALFLLTHRSPAELPEERLKISFRSRVQISESFADWLERAIEPDAGDRFVSAREALGLLQRKISVKKPLTPQVPWKAFIGVGILASIWIGGMKLFKYPLYKRLSFPLSLCGAVRDRDTDTVGSYLLWNGSVTKHSATLLGCSNSVREIKRWIAKGADIHKTDDSGRTPLHMVRSAEVAQYLIDRGIDVNAKTDVNCVRPDFCHGGETPLHNALWKQEEKEIIQILLDSGADVNAQDSQGETILYKFVQKSSLGSDLDKKNKKIIEILISDGANVNLKNPLSLAISHNSMNEEIVRLLVINGANVNIIDSTGMTPLDRAIAQNNSYMIRLLHAYGGQRSGLCKSNHIDVIYCAIMIPNLKGAQIPGYFRFKQP